MLFAAAFGEFVAVADQGVEEIALRGSPAELEIDLAGNAEIAVGPSARESDVKLARRRVIIDADLDSYFGSRNGFSARRSKFVAPQLSSASWRWRGVDGISQFACG